MRIQLGKSSLRLLLGLALMGWANTAAAENGGQADLDKAIGIKAGAHTRSRLTKVIDLCQSALDKGLDHDVEGQCRRLLVATLLERAEKIAKLRLTGDIHWPLSAEDLRAAMNDIERAGEIAPRQPAVKLLLAKLQLAIESDREKACQSLDEAIGLAADDEQVMVEAVRLKMGINDEVDDGLTDLSKAIEVAPKNAELRRMRGEFYLRREQAQQALADFDAAIQLNAQDAESLSGRGMALLALKRYQDARDAFALVVERKPDDPEPLFYLAQASSMAGDPQQAIADANRVLAIYPDLPFGLLCRAHALAQAGDIEQALADANRALELQPDSYGIHLWATIVFKAGRLRSTIKQLRQQVEAHPDNAVAWLQLGLLYSGQRVMGKAVDAYTAAIALGQHRDFAYHLRGDVYLNVGLRKEALADYDESLKLNRDDSGVLNNLAWVLATAPEDELRNGTRALELATRACELTNYQQAHILSTLAAAYAENGDFQTARSWSQKCVAIAAEPVIEQARKELASYEQNKPWREDEIPPRNEPKAD